MHGKEHSSSSAALQEGPAVSWPPAGSITGSALTMQMCMLFRDTALFISPVIVRLHHAPFTCLREVPKVFWVMRC